MRRAAAAATPHSESEGTVDAEKARVHVQPRAAGRCETGFGSYQNWPG